MTYPMQKELHFAVLRGSARCEGGLSARDINHFEDEGGGGDYRSGMVRRHDNTLVPAIFDVVPVRLTAEKTEVDPIVYMRDLPPSFWQASCFFEIAITSVFVIIELYLPEFGTTLSELPLEGVRRVGRAHIPVADPLRGGVSWSRLFSVGWMQRPQDTCVWQLGSKGKFSSAGIPVCAGRSWHVRWRRRAVSDSQPPIQSAEIRIQNA
jgi:hypothetical protein